MTDADYARGREIGAPLGGKALASKPAPSDCQWCQEHGYTRWHQHIGHLGFAAYMQDTARTTIRWKLKHTCVGPKGKPRNYPISTRRK